MLYSRRQVLTFLASAAVLPVAARFGLIGDALAQGMSRTAYLHYFTKPDGSALRLSEYAGKPILIVNTATQCGFVGQYRGLQDLWARYKDRGLLVLAVPSNDFGGQEPLADGDIAHSAHQNYGVDFPLAAKVAVRGAQAHPFYRWAAEERPLDVPRWNFHKYLIGANGQLADVFPTRVEPRDERVVAAIERELKA